MKRKHRLDFQPLIRFLEVLPKSGDKELALLKVHLVIEEVLTKIICKSMKNEIHIHNARLSFFQKCKITQALNEIDHAKWVWHALKLLNQARNELSHNLTTEELAEKIAAFTTYVKTQNKELFESEANEKFTVFHMAAFATYIPLAVHANFDPANVQISTLLTGQSNA